MLQLDSSHSIGFETDTYNVMYISEQCKSYLYGQRIDVIVQLWTAPFQTAARKQSIPAAVCADARAAERLWNEHESALCVAAVCGAARSHGILHRVR